VRLCYAGAEAVKQETRDAVSERLGVRLMEAYGTTECSPVLCGNNMLFNKFGTLGKVAPAIDYRLEAVDGIKDAGEFVVRGPNIMKGYLYADNPGVLVPVEDGWYHTGDVVKVDELGYVKIVDRVKRFAKIAGEMISLTAVDNIAVSIWGTDEFRCGTVAIPSDKKGEQIVMVTNNKEASRATFAEHVRAKGLSELYIPVDFLYKEELPLLATGKADNVSLKKWVLKEKGLA
jgi:acyl-[acyl-carrier-protein]-phospholipid O-acyltransferase/long-chain-fatty-acid--[acyl-carrier-protein] ligase